MAATSSGLLGASLITQGLGSFGNAYAQASAQQAQAEFEQQQLKTNQRLASIQSEDAIIRGDKQASDYKKKVKGTSGSQRAALAAQGIDVGTGSAAEVQIDTAAIGAENTLAIKNNAWREAWGYRMQANEYGSKANFSKIAADASSTSTLLTGGLNALSYGMKAASAFGDKGPSVAPKKMKALSALDHINIFNGDK